MCFYLHQWKMNVYIRDRLSFREIAKLTCMSHFEERKSCLPGAKTICMVTGLTSMPTRRATQVIAQNIFWNWWLTWGLFNVSAFSIQLCGRAATRAGSSFCGKKKKESSEQQHQCWSISFPGRPAVIALVWSIDWVYEIIATSLNYDQRLKSYFLFRMNREAWSERNYRHRS